MKHELVELAQRINWKSVEKDFSSYYADMGCPAIPARKMVGSMLLKQMYGQSDEGLQLNRLLGISRVITECSEITSRVLKVI